MPEPSFGDDSAVILVQSPNEALQPQRPEDELPGLILGRYDYAQERVPNPCNMVPTPFQRSKFTEKNGAGAVKDEGDVNEEKDFKFNGTIQSPPDRQFSLYEALALQVSKLNIKSPPPHRQVAEKIVHTIQESFDCNLGNAASLKDSDLVDKVSEIIQDFLSTSFVSPKALQQREIRIVNNKPRSEMRRIGADKTTLLFYSNILPIDLFDTVTAEFYQQEKAFIQCVALTAKKTRCQEISKLNKSDLFVAMQELSNLPRPRDFAKVIKILLSIVDIAFCTQHHLQKRRFAMFELCNHFQADVNSSNRVLELKCFDEWLGIFCPISKFHKDDNDSVNGETEQKPEIASPKVTSLPISSDIETKSYKMAISNIQDKDVLFLFKHTASHQELGFQPNEFILEPSLTFKSFQPYRWPTKKLKLKPTGLVNHIIREPLTGYDLNRHGCIYVYRHVMGFGFHKIGRSIDVQARLETLETKCGYMIDERDNILLKIIRKAPHPKRLEDIVHAELMYERHQVLGCGGCGQNHREWFRVHADQAQWIVKKWTLWMQKGPYDQEGRFKEGEIDIPVVGDWQPPPTPPKKKIPTPKRRSDQHARKQRLSGVAPQFSPSHSMTPIMTPSNLTTSSLGFEYGSV